MTTSQFDDLLETRDRLRARHESLCEACNEEHSPFRGDVPGAPNAQRDRVYAELEETQALIDQALEAERASE